MEHPSPFLKACFLSCVKTTAAVFPLKVCCFRAIFLLDYDWSRQTFRLKSHLKVHARHHRTAEDISDVDVKFNFNLIESIYNKVQTWKTALKLSITMFFLMLETSNMLDFDEIHWKVRKSPPQSTGKITWFSCSWELQETQQCDAITIATIQHFREVKGHICACRVALHLGRYSFLLSAK